MTRKRNAMKASELNGLFIYHDQKKGTIFYDIFTKRAFIITSSDVQKYLVYTSMFPACILISFGVMSLLSLSLVDMIIMFIALMILTESLFRFFFFYKLPEVKNWKPEKRETVVSYLENNYSSARLTVLTVLLLALAAVIPLYTYIEEMKGIEYYLNYLIAAVALVFAVIVIIALVRKKRNK
ncbi:MAG: hypothetical protein IIZ64_05345 [Erysipelotrichaceae bacterium]|nr:hypothetical protein [Erysipelotrichaceae bacterium]MBQ1788483.1 hypothetical protein [Erysipelotrichaceae bacterium]